MIDMIEIESYESFDGVPFGSSQQHVVDHFGQPCSERLNRENEKEFHFKEFILRFDSKDEGLREVTLLPGAKARWNEREIAWDVGFLKFVCELAPVLEFYGYLVSTKYGIALTGFHDGDESGKAVHFFRNGDWDQFEGQMNSFEL